jgi:hypothetical protein
LQIAVWACVVSDARLSHAADVHLAVDLAAGSYRDVGEHRAPLSSPGAALRWSRASSAALAMRVNPAPGLDGLPQPNGGSGSHSRASSTSWAVVLLLPGGEEGEGHVDPR